MNIINQIVCLHIRCGLVLHRLICNIIEYEFVEIIVKKLTILNLLTLKSYTTLCM